MHRCFMVIVHGQWSAFPGKKNSSLRQSVYNVHICFRKEVKDIGLELRLA